MVKLHVPQSWADVIVVGAVGARDVVAWLLRR